MKSLWQPTLLAAFLILAGCATTTKHQVAVTGDIMVDAPNAIANGPPRDRVLWEYRQATAAMRQGKFDVAKQNLDDALLTLGGIYGKDADAKKARSYFHAEAKKTFIGEPYERSMAYIYRGILYWMDGELEQIGDMSGTDLQALNNQFVSLTPIWFDLTHSDAIPHIKNWNLKWPA